MMHDDIMYEIEARMSAAEDRYGPFASTHEALGVAVEEWDELRAAIRSNDLMAISDECVDLAAVLVRLARACRSNGEFAARSSK